MTGLHPSRFPRGFSTTTTLEMSGSFSLTHRVIDDVVGRVSAGNYALGYMQDAEFVVFFVGRSDSDVRERLHEWVNVPTRRQSFCSFSKAPWHVQPTQRCPTGVPRLGRVENAESSYTRFAYSYAESSVEAYAKEWRNYDDFGGSLGLDNEGPPVWTEG